jgi:UDP-glucosyltransferase 73C
LASIDDVIRMTCQGQAAAPLGLGDADDGAGGTKAAAHFVFVPLNERGHLIPAVDTALLLATHGAVCTIVGPPSTTSKVRQTVESAQQSGLPVRLVDFPLDYAAAGLPEGADDADRIEPMYMMNYYRAVALLRAPIERYLRAHDPYPTCVVNDVFNPWATELAAGLGVPRLSFFSICAFTILCQHNLERFHAYDGVEDSNAPVVVPGLERKVVVTRAQAPGFLRGIPIPEWVELADYIERARAEADGVIVNTVLEMEPEYVAAYAEARGMKVWTVGPVSLYHHGAATLASRGDRAPAIGAAECLRWLDGKEPGSVVYVSFGSIAQASPKQLVELGLGLEASGHPFIWVVRNAGGYDETVRAFLGELEARVAGRGLLVRGWAPQAAILSHAAVGGFVSHCGWNSTLEAIAAGLPLVTWPHFTDQFLNEKMAVEVLDIGVSVGVKEPLMFQARNEILVGRGVVEKAVRDIMGGGEEAERRRQRARELAAKARAAVQEGGSSHANLLDLVKRFEKGASRAA